MKVPSFTRLFDWLMPVNHDAEFRESYRTVLVGQYTTMSPPPSASPAKSEGDRICQIPPEAVTWEDLYQLELVILRLEPLDSLKRRMWTLRNEYRELASPEEIKDYEASGPPKIEAADEAALRADAIRLQEEINWRYVTIWVFESFRGKIVKRLMLATGGLLLIALLLVCVWKTATCPLAAGTDVNLLFVASIFIPGFFGGLVSTINRVQQARMTGNADTGLTDLEQSTLGIYLSPLLGGVFAFLLFCLFAGGFVTGALFPTVTFDSLIVGKMPEGDLANLAKLIVWCFIARFAEKFVPDRLQQFAQNSKDGSAPAGNPSKMGPK